MAEKFANDSLLIKPRDGFPTSVEYPSPVSEAEAKLSESAQDHVDAMMKNFRLIFGGASLAQVGPAFAKLILITDPDGVCIVVECAHTVKSPVFHCQCVRYADDVGAVDWAGRQPLGSLRLIPDSGGRGRDLAISLASKSDGPWTFHFGAASATVERKNRYR